MNVRNCRSCGKLFNYIVGQPICPGCREKMEAKFQEVKKYVREHAHCGIKEVAKECEVDEQQIRQWVKEERLEFAEGSAVGVICENCGTPIKTGRFCDKCKASMINTLNSVGRKPIQNKADALKQDKTNPKMRFMENR